MTPSRFVYRRRVHYHECDIQGIIFNSHLYAYFDEALKELARQQPSLRAVVPGAEAAPGMRASVSEARLRFIAPIRFGQDIDIAVGVAEADDEAVLWEFTVTDAGSRMAEGKLEIRLLGEDDRPHRPVPAAVRAELATLAGPPMP